MDQVLEILRARPSHETLIEALRQCTQQPLILTGSEDTKAVVKALVTDILSAYWPGADDIDELKTLLVQSLATPLGITVLLQHRDKPYSLQVLQEVIALPSLTPIAVIQALSAEGPILERSEGYRIWRQYIDVVASARILTQVAEVLPRFSVDDDKDTISWLADRRQYSAYLARQCLSGLDRLNADTEPGVYARIGEFLDRAVTPSTVSDMMPIIVEAVVNDTNMLPKLTRVFESCSPLVKQYLHRTLLTTLQDKYLQRFTDRNSISSLDRDADRIGAAATLVHALTNAKTAQAYSDTVLRNPSRYSLSVCRALFAVLDKDHISSVTLQNLEEWSAARYIKHLSIMEQEALTETILVGCAYMPFQDLAAMNRGAILTKGISNHLESTSDRIRFLGMILAETISAHVIKDEKKRLTFGVPDMDTAEAQWWRTLIQIEDRPKDLSFLRAGLVDQPNGEALNMTKEPDDSLNMSELIEDVESSDDEEFPSMRMPDSDDEDSDEDPTLVDRERLRAPVYIRDLIQMLNNHESFQHVNLALRTAPSLIRRKANFGMEVSDYAINLAQILAGMRDNFDMDNFQELRQEGLKALVVACPKIVCPYLSQTFFVGDYSLQQRVIILSCIALGAREVAGADEVAARFQNLSVSKVLPPAVLQQYQSIETVSAQMQAQIIAPMKADVQQELSGPDMLKVTKTTRQMARPQQQRQVEQNKLTPIAAEYILFPLMRLFQVHTRKMVPGDADTFYEANLLAYFLRTLSLVFQVSANSPAISRLTQELWSLLLSLCHQTDHIVLEALLLAYLIIIDVNDNRRLALEHSRQLVQTQEWCAKVFEGVREDKIRGLSAAVLMRIREIVDENQLLMMQTAESLAQIGNIGKGRFGLAGLK